MAKKSKKVATTTMIVRQKDVGAIQRLLKDLSDEDKPRKPIKRTEKVSKADFAKASTLGKQIGPLVNKLNKEYERMTDLACELDRLSPQDQKWVDDYIGKLDAALDYIDENTHTSN